MNLENMSRIRNLLLIPLAEFNFTKYITENSNMIKLLLVEQFETTTGCTKEELALIKANTDHFERLLEKLYSHTGEREVAKVFSEKWGETISKKNFTKKKKFYNFLLSIREADSTKMVQILKACAHEIVEIATYELDSVFKHYCSLRHPLKHYIVIKALKNNNKENYQIIHNLESQSKYFSLNWQFIIDYNFTNPHKLKISIHLYITDIIWKEILDSELDEAIRQLASNFSPVPVLEQTSHENSNNDLDPDIYNQNNNNIHSHSNSNINNIMGEGEERGMGSGMTSSSSSSSPWTFQNQNKKNSTPLLIGNNRGKGLDEKEANEKKDKKDISKGSSSLSSINNDNEDDEEDEEEDDLPLSKPALLLRPLDNNNNKSKPKEKQLKFDIDHKEKGNKEKEKEKEKEKWNGNKERNQEKIFVKSTNQTPILLAGEIIQIETDVFLEFVEKVNKDINEEKKKNKNTITRFVNKGNLVKKEKKSKKSSIPGCLILTNYQLIFLSVRLFYFNFLFNFIL